MDTAGLQVLGLQKPAVAHILAQRDEVTGVRLCKSTGQYHVGSRRGVSLAM